MVMLAAVAEIAGGPYDFPPRRGRAGVPEPTGAELAGLGMAVVATLPTQPFGPPYSN